MGLLLTFNAGSSSLKFDLYAMGDEPVEEARGQIENLGSNARLIIEAEGHHDEVEIGEADHLAAIHALIDALEPLRHGREISAIGHRVVHGGTEIDGPRLITPELVDELKEFNPLAPLHQPHNLEGVEAAHAAFPDAIQVACFDTAFHRGHSRVVDTYALPREFYGKGIRRYGFHGLSYDYIAGKLAEDHPGIANGRVIVAHLGNGSSLCALKDGRSIACSMGFSPLDGMPMGTRSGHMDPGILLYLLDHHVEYREIHDLLYKKCGLLGLSGISHDVRKLLASSDPAAADAIDYYALHLSREIASLTADLGGLDALVFTAGIGEHAPAIRAKALEKLGYLGVSLDLAANEANATQIGAGPVQVLVLPTNEEVVIARATMKIFNETRPQRLSA